MLDFKKMNQFDWAVIITCIIMVFDGIANKTSWWSHGTPLIVMYVYVFGFRRSILKDE